MPEKAEALGILLVLLPGFAAAYFVQLLATRRKQSELDKVVEALIFSLLLYVITLPFFRYSLPIAWHAGLGERSDTITSLCRMAPSPGASGSGIGPRSALRRKHQSRLAHRPFPVAQHN